MTTINLKLNSKGEALFDILLDTLKKAPPGSNIDRKHVLQCINMLSKRYTCTSDDEAYITNKGEVFCFHKSDITDILLSNKNPITKAALTERQKNHLLKQLRGCQDEVDVITQKDLTNYSDEELIFLRQDDIINGVKKSFIYCFERNISTIDSLIKLGYNPSTKIPFVPNQIKYLESEKSYIINSEILALPLQFRKYFKSNKVTKKVSTDPLIIEIEKLEKIVKAPDVHPYVQLDTFANDLNFNEYIEFLSAKGFPASRLVSVERKAAAIETIKKLILFYNAVDENMKKTTALLIGAIIEDYLYYKKNFKDKGLTYRDFVADKQQKDEHVYYEPSTRNTISSNKLILTRRGLTMYAIRPLLVQIPQNQIDNITYIDISYNILSSIPDEILQFKNLKKLDASDCHLESLNNRINELTNLTELSLFDNKLTTLRELWNHPSLKTLDAGFNDIKDDSLIFPEITDIELSGIGFRTIKRLVMPKLDELRLTFSFATHTIFELEECRLDKLEKLVLSNLNVKGDLPASICQITSLSDLVLISPRIIIKNIPECYTQLVNLDRFTITGGRPKFLHDIGNMNHITQLNIMNSHITDKELSESISKLKLTHFNLSGSLIIKTLPNWITKIPTLSYLDISRTGISDIPDLRKSNLVMLRVRGTAMDTIQRKNEIKKKLPPRCKFE